MVDETNNENTNEGQDDASQGEDSDFGALTGGEGMGNLPPLSDFDSGAGDDAGGGSDSGLPPLGGESPPPGEDFTSPLGDQSILDAPSGRDAIPTPSFDTPPSDLDTPEPGGGAGFQDFAADSDFSPETPEIGPGPDSDIETPMFDSAFGGEGADFGSPGTPSPTQAMETPMFDTGTPSPSGGMGFDQDAFGVSPSPGVSSDMGTPVPDFSPDTGIPTPGVGVPAGGGRGKGSGGIGGVVVALIAILALAGGIVAGPFLASVLPLPNPGVTKVTEEKDAIIATKDQQIRKLTDQVETQGTPISQEVLDQLILDVEAAQANKAQLERELGTLQDSVRKSMDNLALIQEDIDQKNAEFVVVEELLDAVNNKKSLAEAQHAGLLVEIERLADMVGSLEVANLRRQATKEALLHNLDLLTIQINGGSPLAPSRFAHAERKARASELREKVLRTSWVDPALMTEYTELYLAELGIAASREYFFARIPVHNRLGDIEYFWAECLMNGNWSVYYRTLDGKHVGSYENVSGTATPDYVFREDLSGDKISDIEGDIIASRVDGYEDKFEVLRRKQAVYEQSSKLNKNFTTLGAL
jgi:hypothetical protein